MLMNNVELTFMAVLYVMSTLCAISSLLKGSVDGDY